MRRMTTTAGIAVATAALAASGIVAAVAAAPPPAHIDNTVGLKTVGPIDESNGFPLWYEDTNGVKLELCTDPGDPYCIMGEVPNPDAPVHFPDNFPDEAFWAAAESPIDAGGGETGLLVTALEAAFQNELPAVNEGVSFGRVRIRVAGVIDGATYRVTHPFGTDTIVAEAGAVKGLNTTEDIGNLTWDGVFDQTLAARVGPFLKWDPDVAPAAPTGYLGDVTVEHTVVGSPYDTNFFRVEGPAGSFTGSTQLCENAALGDDPVATDDCIENDQFAVQGKIATRMGVEVLKANYRDTGSSANKYIDIWAKSAKDQRLVVSGTNISQTIMSSAGNGEYFVRVAVDGAPPADLVVTNTSDSPRTTSHVKPSHFGDKVHVISARWDTSSKALEVVADSGSSSSTLTLVGYPDAEVTLSGSNGVRTFVVPDLPAPPAEVTVMSDQNGRDGDDVVITGGEFDSAQVVAAITADTNEISVGQTLTFDSIASQGTIVGREWSVTNGGSLTTPTAQSTTLTPGQPGDYVVTLRVTGPGTSNTDTATFTVHVSGAATPPVANAGVDQLNVIPTSVVTLNGGASQFATGYQWTAPSGITLSATNTANPTFTVPTGTTNGSWTFTLTVTGTPGTTPATDTVTVTSDVDDVTVDQAQYKRGSLEWRVRGTAQYCSANNTITVSWMRNGVKTRLGTATPAGDLGVCTYDFRLRNTPAGLRATTAGTIVVESVLGGSLTTTFNLL